MSDYIKREDAIEEINKTLNMFGREHTITDYDAIDCILTVPSADVVEVVRCKDCKWRYSTSDCTHWLPCMDIIYNHDFYCGYGERADA